jgi:hypothetical protein
MEAIAVANRVDAQQRQTVAAELQQLRSSDA